MNRFGAVGALAASLVFLGLPGRASSASVDLDEVAAALRSDPVYVDVDAERALTDDRSDELRSVIRNANTPIYIAVLPASAADVAGGDPAEVASQLVDAVDRRGTYGVVVGESFRAGSSELPDGEAGGLAAAALDAHGDDTAAVLQDFVERVRDATGSSDGSAGSGDDGSGRSWVLPVVLAAGVGAAGLIVWRRSKRRQEQAAERRAYEADRQLLKAEISVLADDVVRLEPIVQLHPDAQSDFDAAVSRYRAAQAALEHTNEPLDLVRVARVVGEARYSMDRARATVEGREPPPPPEELQRPGQHGEPAVTLDNERQPAYVGYPGSFQGGWFGGSNGLFSGLLLGSILTGGFGGWGAGGTTIINEADDGGGGGDGDFDGGDFGGGDFGGGDF